MQTVIGAFEDRSTAQRAIERLELSGFDRKDIHLEQGEGGAKGAAGHWQFFQALFGGGDRAASEGESYDEAVRRGHCVLVVDAHSDTQAERAASVMDESGALDLDDRSRWWDTGKIGTVSGVASGAAAGMPPGTLPGVLTPPTAGTAIEDAEPGHGPDAAARLAPEERQVGHRARDRGAVRVVQRVAGPPVHEIVRLRESNKDKPMR